MIHESLTSVLKELHLPTVRASYEKMAAAAVRDTLSYEEYLLMLMEHEQEVRRQNRITKLLRESHLPTEKTLSSFDRKRLPERANHLLTTLLDGRFMERCENILAFGNPGGGKTHLLCAIGQEMIQRHGRRVLFSPCNLMVQNLLIAKRDLKLSKLLKSLSKYDVIIIDDIGYVQQSREEMEVLFTLLADCYERTSIMITSNLPFSKWEQIFKDPMTTAAAIDRLVHHSVILELNLPSYRLEISKEHRL